MKVLIIYLIVSYILNMVRFAYKAAMPEFELVAGMFLSPLFVFQDLVNVIDRWIRGGE